MRRRSMGPASDSLSATSIAYGSLKGRLGARHSRVGPLILISQKPGQCRGEVDKSQEQKEDASELQEPPGVAQDWRLVGGFHRSAFLLAGCAWVQAPEAPACSRGSRCVAHPPFRGDAPGTRGPPKRYPEAAGRRTPPSFAVVQTIPCQVRNGHEILRDRRRRRPWRRAQAEGAFSDGRPGGGRRRPLVEQRRLHPFDPRDARRRPSENRWSAPKTQAEELAPTTPGMAARRDPS